MQAQKPLVVKGFEKLGARIHVRHWRRRNLFFSLISICLLVFVVGGSLLVQTFFSVHSAYAAAPANTAVLSFKNDNAHSGLNANETLLNTNNVNVNQFGKQVSYPVDGQVYAQPLYVPNVTINGNLHNVVFVATEHDSIYAFDADQTTTIAPLWQRSFLGNGATSVSTAVLLGCGDTSPEVGITGTPVIDSSTNTMYVVAFTNDDGVSNVVYRLHAIDLTTGLDKGTPIVLQGAVSGTGPGQVNGVVAFQAIHERQRAALVMANGQIYIAFGSFCDIDPYHGWILSYTFNGTNFQQSNQYNDTPNASGAGLWGSGGGLSADASGNIYVMSGNGDADLAKPGPDGGDSFLKLNPQLQLQDYFTPFNDKCLKQRDTDLGSGGPLLIGNKVYGGGKEGRIYTLDSNNLGKFTFDPNLDCTQGSTEPNTTAIDSVLQEFPPGTMGGIYSSPVYWNGPNGQYVYFSGSGSNTRAFRLDANGLLSSAATSQTPESFSFTGSNPIISSNGTAAGTGILWLIDPHAVLRAYDASNLATELYNSGQNAARDGLGSYVKFSTPTVANGEVFVGTANSLVIYSLHVTTTIPTPTPTPSGPPPAAYNNVAVSDDTSPGTGDFDGNKDSYSYQSLVVAGLNPGDNAFHDGMVFTWPNAIPGTPNNYVPNGQTIPIVNPVTNANLLGFLGASANGAASGLATINYVDGTHQTFTLGFADWHQTGTLPFNNSIETISTYYNNGAGKQTQTTSTFYTDVVLAAGRVVQSVTLPATAGPGTMHIFAVSTKYVPQAAVYNNIGTSDDSAPATGIFDGTNSYSAQALAAVNITPGATVSYNGVNFIWPNVMVGTPNNYAAKGQMIPVNPVPNATTLAVLGSSTDGNSTGTAVITYTDGTTQSFPLGLSDWTLGGGYSTPAYGNKVVATTAYRNTPGGQQTTDKPTILYADVTLNYPGKTVQSLTLPATMTGGQLHVFAVSTKATLLPPPLNNVGVSNDSDPTAGHFDGSNSYSAQALAAVKVTPGATITYNGVNFTWPNAPAGSSNNYVANGQVVPVNPVTGATALAFLGSSMNGNNSGFATITYIDGTTQVFTLGMSDWTLGWHGSSGTAFGNQVVATTAYRNTPSGADTTENPTILYAEVALAYPGKTILSVTLPTGGQIHIFAISTKAGGTSTATPTPTPAATPTPTATATPTATPTPAPAVYNNSGTSDDSSTYAGHFDGSNSYSAQALAAVNITAGGTVAFNGVSFVWPSSASGQANNYVAQGQVLPVTPVTGATTLAFLGSASEGNTSGVATITYTDGTIQTFVLGLSDWTLGWDGTAPPAYGNKVVATTAYRNTTSGMETAHKPVVLYADVALAFPGKTVQSVTLPSTTTGGQLHIFAVATK